MKENFVALRVWGDFACFTRPEMKVERVSYSVMTPSAARGVLEAIFWEPEIYYLIDTLHVVQRGQWFSVSRNEVKEKVGLGNVKKWMKDPSHIAPIRAGGGAPDGTPRHMLALAQVEYLICAEVRLSGLAGGNLLKKYCSEIQRRLKSGKCFHRPYLGMREFAADFEEVDDLEATFRQRTTQLAAGRPVGLPSEDLGVMLYDVFAPEARAHGFRWLPHGDHHQDPRAHPDRLKKGAPKSGLGYVGTEVKAESLYFHAVLDQGRIDCHPDRVRWAKTPPGVDL